jgi:hypothetical protein
MKKVVFDGTEMKSEMPVNWLRVLVGRKRSLHHSLIDNLILE